MNGSRWELAIGKHIHGKYTRPNGKFSFFPSLFPSSATAIGSARERAVTRGQIPVDQKKRKEFFFVCVCLFLFSR